MLSHIRNVAWRFEKKLVPDFVLGEKNCALFISVRYHLLKPAYLARRLAEVRCEARWRLRVLLCHVDLGDSSKALHDLNILAVKSECTLILAHSPREAARYLECFKAYEKNSASCIKDKVDTTHGAVVADALTTVKPVNKTDVATLSARFPTFRDLLKASLGDLKECPGLGDKKVARLHDAFNVPFSMSAKRKRDDARRRAEAVEANRPLDDDVDEDYAQAAADADAEEIASRAPPRPEGDVDDADDSDDGVPPDGFDEDDEDVDVEGERAMATPPSLPPANVRSAGPPPPKKATPGPPPPRPPRNILAARPPPPRAPGGPAT